jgi:hypothetical protein
VKKITVAWLLSQVVPRNPTGCAFAYREMASFCGFDTSTWPMVTPAKTILPSYLIHLAMANNL